MSERSPHSELMEFDLSAELRIGASVLPPQGDAKGQMERWADRAQRLEEQQEDLVRVANAAVAYCSDLNNRGEGNTDDLEAAIAELYPAGGLIEMSEDEKRIREQLEAENAESRRRVREALDPASRRDG